MKKSLLIRWIIGGLFFFFALISLAAHHLMTSLLLSAFSFWVSPLSTQYIFNKLSFKLPTWSKIVIGSLLFTFFIMTLPSSAETTKQNNSPVLSATDSQNPENASLSSEISSEHIPTATPTPDIYSGKEQAKVVNVVDGDTVKLEDGRVLRYIGMDTPETVNPKEPVQCFGKEASKFNELLVEGKDVWLEKDVSETDRYGRILRYVYVLQDNNLVMVNKILVDKGYAVASSYPPDVKYQSEFSQLEQNARENKEGMWADDACPAPTIKPTSTPRPVIPTKVPATPIPTQIPVYTPPTSPPVVNQPDSGSWPCNCSKTCPQMSSCAEAQYQLNVCGCTRRDADNDGIACDADC